MFNVKNDYGLKALFELGQSANQQKSIEQIARAQRIPSSYLEKILQRYRAQHLVVGKRGRTGGYRLARAPNKITLLEIIRAQEGSFAPVACLRGEKCRQKENCLTAPGWQKIWNNMAGYLKSVTLATIINGSRQ